MRVDCEQGMGWSFRKGSRSQTHRDREGFGHDAPPFGEPAFRKNRRIP